MNKQISKFERAFQLHQSGNPKGAIEIYLKILRKEKDDPHLLFLLGTACSQVGRHQDGLDYLKKSVKLSANPITFNNLGSIYSLLKRDIEAIDCFNKAISMDPRYAEAYCNRGAAQTNINLLEESLDSCNRALELEPIYPVALLNRGNALWQMGDASGAIDSYDRAIEIVPNYAEVLNARGSIMQALKRWDDAFADYEKAVLFKPDIDYLIGTKLDTQMHLCNWDGFNKQIDELETKIEQREKASLPFPLLALIDSPSTHKAASQIYIDNKFPLEKVVPGFASSTKDSKIRVGYFSADFHEHATMHLMAEMFEKHDKTRFEFIAFSFGPISDDAWQTRAKNAFDKFIGCHGQSDSEIAELSRSLGIDIAVDLKGFTQDARTGIFAARAAPIQVNFIGYPGTMGANYIDYLIADEVLIPPETRNFYTEKIAYLPNSYQPNCRTREVSNKPISRSVFGLPEEGIVFSSFNNNYKITPQVFASWMRILKAVEGSVLWLFSSNETAEDNLRKHAKENGVDPKRIVFAQKLPVDEHLSRIPLADLMLDTFPYGAHTTCSDALRMGLPVVTLKGESFASRVAASLLTTIGTPQLIADSLASYEDLAVELAKNPDNLAEVRASLATNIKSSPLFNPDLFARNIETLYTTMYQRHKDGLPPDHIFASH